MNHEIIKYPVQNPLLKRYIKFFWGLHIDRMEMNHKLIPQRNINLRFNLSETPQYMCLNGKNHLLEHVYFSGLQDHFGNACLKLSGKVDMLGICFQPDGFFPFSEIPVSEFKNQILGADEIGFKTAISICEQLKEVSHIKSRLEILENRLALLLEKNNDTTEYFRKVFNILEKNHSTLQLSEFCRMNNMGIRTLERMFNKFVGVSANSYLTLNRFHKSLNQILRNDYSKLSDLAYDNGYFDQMHFIRDFKRFAGNTPKSFIEQNNSILNIGKLT